MSSSNAFPASSSPAPAGALDARAGIVMTALCVLWSLQQISLKAIAAQASPIAMVATRSLIAAVLLAMLMARRGERLQRACLRPGLVVGALFALEYVLVSAALERTQASHVVVFLYTAPISAAIGLQWRLPQERLSLVQWCGIALAFCGIAAAFRGGMGATPLAGGQSLAGDALALGGGIAWGATTVTLRSSALAAAPATETLLYQLGGAVAVLPPIAWVTGAWHLEATAAVGLHLAFQSVVVSFASFLTWCWLLRRYLASQLGVFSFLTPLFGVLLGVWLLDERLDPHFVFGSGLVLVGIAAVSAHAWVARVAMRRLGARAMFERRSLR